MSYTVKRIAPEFVAQRWDEVKDYIASALVYAENDYSLEQVKVFLVNNSWLLLGVYQDNVIKGAITVAFTNMPNDRIAFITTIGGKHISNPQAYQEFINILNQSKELYASTKKPNSHYMSSCWHRYWRILLYQTYKI